MERAVLPRAWLCSNGTADGGKKKEEARFANFNHGAQHIPGNAIDFESVVYQNRCNQQSERRSSQCGVPPSKQQGQ
jgi:hypothetical protein